MPAIYPSVALKNQQKEIKEIADREIVYVTENGRGKYVFMSQEVSDRELFNAKEDALYEDRVMRMFEESLRDMAEGRYYTSWDEMMAVREERQAKRG